MTKEKIEALGKEISEKLNKTDANYIFVAMPDANVKDYFFALKFNDNGKFVSMLFAALQTYIKTQGENPISLSTILSKLLKSTQIMPKRFRTQIEACNSFAELLAQILAQREFVRGKKLLKLDEKLIKTCEKFIDETERIKFQERIIRKPLQRRNAKCSQTV